MKKVIFWRTELKAVKELIYAHVCIIMQSNAEKRKTAEAAVQEILKAFPKARREDIFFQNIPRSKAKIATWTAFIEPAEHPKWENHQGRMKQAYY